MKDEKLKKLSLTNLIVGYIIISLFLFLIVLNLDKFDSSEEVVTVINEPADTNYTALFDGVTEDDVASLRELHSINTGPVNIDPEGREIVYVDRDFVRDSDIGLDHGRNLIINRDLDLVGQTKIIDDSNIYEENLNTYTRVFNSNNLHSGINDSVHVNDDSLSINDRGNSRARPSEVIDTGLLDRRLRESGGNALFLNNGEDSHFNQESVPLVDANNIGLDLGGNNSIDPARLELDEGGEHSDDLGSVADFADRGEETGKGSAPGIGEGLQVYAYDFPSQGVGAGIGSAGVGAAAGYAGIGAGIGEAVLNGKTVPALGGVGTSPFSASNLELTPENDQDNDGISASLEAELGTSPTNPDTDGDGVNDGEEVSSYSNPLSAESTPSNPGTAPLARMGGVAGLSNGAGAGAAAGLVTGSAKVDLGLGIGGITDGSGSGIGRKAYNYDHLPKDGALHIMMHVDGSGSILNTRKQLDIMKDTLLKTALLPYYNNSESLYNRRVTIVGDSGERSLRFFTQAAKKGNVLAIAFQDEAQPVYHLPTFNKNPEKNYLDDLGNLKSSLNGYSGIYRGVMFQVDRGKTFAKSFKEFVECAWRGEGYLETANLKKYHKDNNLHHIKNKDGIVFSDEYHAKDSGDPQYYLDLIFEASRKIGLDLNMHGAGLKDGKNITN